VQRLRKGTGAFFALLAFVIGSFSIAGVFAAPSGSDATVGGFAVHLAKSLNLPSPKGGFTAESARLALWKAGVRIPADHKRALKESDVVSTLSQMGFNLSTDRPARVVSEEKADSIIATFVNAAALSASARNGSGFSVIEGNGGDDFNNGNGKGGKFKRKKDKSPSDPGDDG